MPGGRVGALGSGSAISRAPAALLAIVAVVGAYAFMGQDTSDSQSSHLALVRALARGTAQIDETRRDLGNIVTNDVDFHEGHVYSSKAPGLALATLPAFLALEAAGMRTSGDPTLILWALGLFGSVLPAALTLLLVRAVAERLQPGFGTATAVSLGLGTLLFPFATLFFAHALSAFLVFAAFTILWHERRGNSRLPLVAAAGLVAGYAITTEYPNALAAAILGLYAVSRGVTAGRAGAYALGLLAGITPLLLYNWWAFGSLTTFLHGYAATSQGPGLPSVRIATELLFTSWGPVQTTPVLAVGAAGIFLLHRRGLHAEAAVVAAMGAAYIAFNSALPWPWGGTAGMRYSIVMLPFLALPLALAYRAWPALTAALAAASVILMTAMTATRPLIAYDGNVLDRLTSSDGSSQTVFDFLGITGWYDIVPLYLAVAAAVIFTILSAPVRLLAGAGRPALAALLAWATLAMAAPRILASDSLGRSTGAVLVLALAAAACLAVVVLVRQAPRPQSSVAALRRG